MAKVPSSRRFPDVSSALKFSETELKWLAYWDEIDAFKESLRRTVDRPHYNFYDGPPFATGEPHYGHILAGTMKDVVCRFAQQTGYHVPRRFGWDCHGLPIEFEIEKVLGIKTSHDVMKIGIARYNDECRKIVLRYANIWEKVINRSGRWIDIANAYKTMDKDYMESVWWVFKQLWNKGLVERGFKVMPYSAACTTPLSNFESNMNYKDVHDPAITVAFKICDRSQAVAQALSHISEEMFLLAWTTTPWTLPSNLGLVVHPTLRYIAIRDKASGRIFICAEELLSTIYPSTKKKQAPKCETLASFVGSELADTSYEPLFDYFRSEYCNAFHVVCDEYVTADSGTGIVHAAPGFGEEDFRVCIANNITTTAQIPCPVDANGHFTDRVWDFKGRNVQSCNDDICQWLKQRGQLIRKESIIHSYPFCWLSDTPLIYRAIDAWFIRADTLREQLVKANNVTNWVPDFVKSKRFTNWLSEAREWNVSRNRYWGTPLPIWANEDFTEVVCVGSSEELEKLSGVSGITDLHREHIDSITIPSATSGSLPLRRVPQVFDCWFESGSMPYAQIGYPRHNVELFSKVFPAQFIAEGLDQTRGWFYTLLVLGTALFDQAPFEWVCINGMVLADDGQKMSKSKRNYPPVDDIFAKYGADAVRLYLINSPAVRGEPIRFTENGVFGVIKFIFVPLVNALKFFVLSANHHLHQERGEPDLLCGTPPANPMDRWILAAVHTLVRQVRENMRSYRLDRVVPDLVRFIDILTNWYVRMNRRRLKGVQDDPTDVQLALSTLFTVFHILSSLLAPFMPFLAETLYQTLRPCLQEQEESVHFTLIADVDESLRDDVLERAMRRFMSIIELVRVVRDRRKHPLRMPLRQVTILHPSSEFISDIQSLRSYIAEELHADELMMTSDVDAYVMAELDLNFAVAAKRLGRQTGVVRAALRSMQPTEVSTFIAAGGGTVANNALMMDDVRIIRKPLEAVTNNNTETHTDGDVVVLIDLTMNEAMKRRWRVRDFVGIVQQMRKKHGLTLADMPHVRYGPIDSSEQSLQNVSIIHEALIAHTDEVKIALERAASVQRCDAEPSDVFASSVEVVGGIPINIYFVW